MINEGIGILFRMPVFIRSGIHLKNSRYAAVYAMKPDFSVTVISLRYRIHGGHSYSV